MTSSARDRFTTGALFVAALGLYVATLNATVQAADSGEFQLVAGGLGIAHPPGYPLYTMLGWAAMQLARAGGFAPLAGLSALSALASALTLVLVYLSVTTTAARAQPRWLPPLAGVAAALVLATSTTFWAQATTANIRSLTALFTAAMLYCAARAARGRSALAHFAAAFGLGAGHHVSLLIPGAVLGAYVLLQRVTVLSGERSIPHTAEDGSVAPTTRSRTEWATALIVLLATQLIWLYLPLRDVPGAPLAPGGLRTVNGFLDHVLARGFGGDFFYFVRVEPERFWDRIALIPTLIDFQFDSRAVIALALGVALALWRLRGLALAALGAAVLHAYSTLTYRAPQTVEYAIPVWVLLCALAGMGFASVMGENPLTHLRAPSAIARAGVCACALGLAVLGAFSGGAARWASFRALMHDAHVGRDAYLRLSSARAGDVILSQWHEATPMWVVQRGLSDAPRGEDVTVEYVAPAGEPYAETFAKRAAALLSANPARGVYVSSFFESAFESAGLAIEPVPSAPLWRARPRAQAPPLSPGATFDGRIDVEIPESLRTLEMAVTPGQALPVELGWRVRGEANAGEALSVRFFRADGRLAGNADVALRAGGGAQRRRLYVPVPLDLTPGDYALQLAAYRRGDAGFQALTTADGADRVTLFQFRVDAASTPAVSARTLAGEDLSGRLLDAPRLLGVDYDLGIPSRVRLWTHWQLAAGPMSVTVLNAQDQPVTAASGLAMARHGPRFQSLAFDIPPERGLRVRVGERTLPLPDYRDGERYVPFGDQMALIGVNTHRAGTYANVDLTWLAARPIRTDWIVSVRLTGAEPGGRLNAAHDGVPALGAIPALKWLRGARVIDRHPLDVDDSGPPYRGSVVVYDSVSGQELPVMDERYEGGFEWIN